MTERNALSRQYKNLLARRERLGKKLVGELAYLHDGKAKDATGDSADLALEAGGDEMSSLLLEQDDRELNQIERALARLQQGKYGMCAGSSWNCQKKIPAARLKAIPHTPYCINCELEMETHLDAPGSQTTGNWSQVSDGEALMQDQRINLSELEVEMSGSWQD